MNTKGLLLSSSERFFECGWAYGLKHAASMHESLLTVICVIASFLYLCLLLNT